MWCKHLRPKNFPPGPTPLPILGNLLNLSVHNPMRDLERLRKSYGNVYSLFIGPKPIVVINGVQALKEAVLTKGADFGGRPQNIFATHLTENAYFSLQLYDSTPIIRNLPLPFMKGFKNMESDSDDSSFSEDKLVMFMTPCSQASSISALYRSYKAVIHEVQRTANTVPFSVYHLTTKDTKPMGCSLPKGTVVIPNMKSVLNEEGQWTFPHEFNPENFLNDEGEFVQPEAFMPFCAGPRMCPGERLAQMKFFLIIVTLLRKFKCIWPEDAGEPDYTPVMGVTLSPHPYRIKVQLRTTQ
ncbi:hypothetical protein NQZ68_016204 [Dissostichus eleginoides]|nr:hypothetical protein NQZ68_016204 [Dissostichus eleginoides]